MVEVSDDEGGEDAEEDEDGTHLPGGGSKGEIVGELGVGGAKIDDPVHTPGGGSGDDRGKLEEVASRGNLFKTTVLWLIVVLISPSLLSEGLEGKTFEGVAATFGCKTVAEEAVADSGLGPKPVA